MASENIETNISEEVKRKRGRPRKLVKKSYVKTGNRRGRPSSYNENTAQVICDQLARGRTLEAICYSDENIPCPKSVYNWLDENNPAYQADFSNNYMVAKRIALDDIISEVKRLSDRLAREKTILPTVITDKKKYALAIKKQRMRLRRNRLQFQYWKWRYAHLQPRKNVPDYF